MNIQEAYNKLDLARGLGKDRIYSQYVQLKGELESKILVTKNEKLKDVYQKRLEEVEEAYAFLVSSLEGDATGQAPIPSDVTVPDPGLSAPMPPPSMPIPPPSMPIPPPISYPPAPKSNSNKVILIIGIAVVLLLAGLSFLYFKTSLLTKGHDDIFRVMEGEQRVFVNNLTLRPYANQESGTIQVFPFGTRFIYDETQPAQNGDKNTVWRKVRVMHPVYGWDRPDENTPYQYEGWMAIQQCGVNYVEDTSKYNKLAKILSGVDAGKAITSEYRHALVDYFERNNYLGEWMIYPKDKTESFQNSLSIKLESSIKDCNGESRNQMVTLLSNKSGTETKLLLITIDPNGSYRVLLDENFNTSSAEIVGMRKLTSQELNNFNTFLYYEGMYSVSNAVYLNSRNLEFNMIGIQNGQVFTKKW